jgi:ankyrin repeat protein
LLLERGADSTVQNKAGWTPLHAAVHWGHEDVACFLLDYRVDPTAHERDAWTLLHLVSQWGHEEVAHLLVEHGADTTGVVKQVVTPWQLALLQADTEISRSFERNADAGT